MANRKQRRAGSLPQRKYGRPNSGFGRPPGISDRAALYAGDETEHAALVQLLRDMRETDDLAERLKILGTNISEKDVMSIRLLVQASIQPWLKKDPTSKREPSGIMLLVGATTLLHLARAELAGSLQQLEMTLLPRLYECVEELAQAIAHEFEDNAQAHAKKEGYI